MKGLEKIMDEREKQIEKGYDSEHDEQHEKKELFYASFVLMCLQAQEAPMNISAMNSWFRSLPKWMQKIASNNESSYEDSLRVAGALIAAELNRISD